MTVMRRRSSAAWPWVASALLLGYALPGGDVLAMPRSATAATAATKDRPPAAASAGRRSPAPRWWQRTPDTQAFTIFTSTIANPVREVLKGVKDGKLVYQRENPNKTPERVVTRELINLRDRYDEWKLVAAANFTPRQEAAEAGKNNKNFEMRRTLAAGVQGDQDALGKRLFPGYASISDGISAARRGEQVVVEKSVSYVHPPSHLYDSRVPAAETILAAARSNPAYRRQLAPVTSNPARLARFLANPKNRPRPGQPLSVNQELYRDLSSLIEKAFNPEPLRYSVFKFLNTSAIIQQADIATRQP